MHRFFISSDMINGNTVKITNEDAEHISKVLRLRLGDNIIICDGEKNEYTCSILSIEKKMVLCSIIESREIITEPTIKVHLFQGIPKSTKMDLIVQKCTELGIDSVIPMETERVVVKLKGDKDFKNKITRWQRIMQEASKQSGRGKIPSMEEPVSYKEAMDRIKDYDLAVIPYEKEDTKGLKHILKGKNNIDSIAIFIGPEGGFSDDEICTAIAKGAIPVTLGRRILRTETAGFACLTVIMYELGDMGGEPWEK